MTSQTCGNGGALISSLIEPRQVSAGCLSCNTGVSMPPWDTMLAGVQRCSPPRRPEPAPLHQQLCCRLPSCPQLAPRRPWFCAQPPTAGLCLVTEKSSWRQKLAPRRTCAPHNSVNPDRAERNVVLHRRHTHMFFVAGPMAEETAAVAHDVLLPDDDLCCPDQNKADDAGAVLLSAYQHPEMTRCVLCKDMNEEATISSSDMRVRSCCNRGNDQEGRMVTRAWLKTLERRRTLE